MLLDEYATRSRLQHPTIPEQFYGRLAKLENLNVENKNTEPSTITAAPTTTVDASGASSAPLELTVVLKLSLRRESASGSAWVKPQPLHPLRSRAGLVLWCLQMLRMPKLHHLS